MTEMTKLEAHLLTVRTPTYTSYYNGKMSYKLHGQSWDQYVSEAFPDLKDQNTSENVFKAVIDLYAENLVPVPDELSGFSNVLVPLLSRGECPVVVDSAGTPHFPEHYEMMSDGQYTVAAIYTRSLAKGKDYVTFAYSDGTTNLFQKDIPVDFGPAEDGVAYEWVETKTDNTFFRFALDDRGFGATMAALQDRVNHSIIDQTVVAEMYARPFWYLLKFEAAPVNPYIQGPQAEDKALQEQKGEGAAGRIFTTSAEGPFGQLDPPTITDMIGYHDSITDKVSQSSGIPQFYFKPGSSAPPTGVALKVLSKRFNNRLARMRDDLNEELERLAELLGVEKTGKDKDDKPTFELWNTSDDLLQESLDAHGIALTTMGYPLEYIASVVTPGVDLADYQEEPAPLEPGQVDPRQTQQDQQSQQGATPAATPDQVVAYATNPGQRAKVSA